ncbi:hypothetical protein ABFS82_04G122900 [Erythranthe guttata]|uniref:uncharacterized protein LOC105951647 n=1 Tax=Erythranthe guttata TaxID=4155 RepID=UPI00064D8C14|nr:PREDICTED: uncharacterized protein LOC105951647 [Erythranthe guttata]|eukprot:XP_012830551.1 PREDICTED: uncharacterized protein LOC105951647 [Erythranthe guttata]
MQTMMPTKPTETRKTMRINNLPPQNSNSNILQRRLHILLCYTKASEQDSGWILAGRMKESLGKALEEEPILAGRLRRLSEESDGGGGGDFEIVSNDAGVRTVEVKADHVKLAEFVDELKANKREAHELVYWEDIVQHNPQFSPLIYIQVTNFTCGGYSIGITSSLLLVDPFTFSNFLKKWCKIHKTIFSRTNTSKIPYLYFPNYASSPNDYRLIMGSNYKTCKNNTNASAQSVILTVPKNILHNNHKNLAALCIEEAERKTGSKMASSLSLLLHKLPCEEEDTYYNKVEMCSRKGLLEGLLVSENEISGLINTNCAIRTWDELGLDSLCFDEGNKADYVSCWISSSPAVSDEGSVMIISPSGDDTDTFGIKVVVTFD